MEVSVTVIAWMPRHHGDKYPWVMIMDMDVQLSNGAWIKIPKGMRTDLSSVPKFLWSILPPYGDFLLAAIIHDFLYIFDYMRKEWGDKKARKFADDEMLYWSNKLNKNKADNYIRYFGVRIFGGLVYKSWNSGKMEELKEINNLLIQEYATAN